MKIAIASDHAGFAYKQKIIAFLKAARHEVRDFGTNSEDPVDYPLFIHPAAEAVARGEYERGIVLGGSGNGEAMVANKYAAFDARSAGLNKPRYGHGSITTPMFFPSGRERLMRKRRC